MSMPRGKKIAVGYATVIEESGANYRTIAEKMTAEGHPMNHASARNWVLRVMKKFAISLAEGKDLNEAELEQIARSPNFQSAIADLIQKSSTQES